LNESGSSPVVLKLAAEAVRQAGSDTTRRNGSRTTGQNGYPFVPSTPAATGRILQKQRLHTKRTPEAFVADVGWRFRMAYRETVIVQRADVALQALA
jgi:hypothetical protein